MLDDGRAGDAGDPDGDVRFSPAGARAVGAFRCADCGYGVTVHRQLPRCPMCGGTTWEASPTSAGSPAERQLL